jgi:histidine ammonia-lyase
MCENLACIVAIELLAAAQGIDFRRPLRSGPVIEAAHAVIRSDHPPLEQDRPLGGEIEALAGELLSGRFLARVAAAAGGAAGLTAR